MAKVTEIKFFKKDGELYLALFGNPPAFWCNEFWLENVKAKDYGISTLPPGLKLEKKYDAKSIEFDNLTVDSSSYEMQKNANDVGVTALKALFGKLF